MNSQLLDDRSSCMLSDNYRESGGILEARSSEYLSNGLLTLNESFK
jgi:hypothetical protein